MQDNHKQLLRRCSYRTDEQLTVIHTHGRMGKVVCRLGWFAPTLVLILSLKRLGRQGKGVTGLMTPRSIEEAPLR